MLKDPSKAFVEIVDPTPIHKPTRLRIPTQSERIMAYVRLEQMRAQEQGQFESFEEADDFEMEDGEVWFSPYEEVFEASDAASLPPPAGAEPSSIEGSVKPQTAPPGNVPRSDDGPVST